MLKLILLSLFIFVFITTSFCLSGYCGTWTSQDIETYEIVQRVLITFSCEIVIFWHFIQILRYFFED